MDVNFKLGIDGEQVQPEQQIKPIRSCDICSKPNALYTCPRCNISYCNLACYQSPNHFKCSEEFYKEQVIDELKNCHIDNVNRSKVASILKRDLERAERENYDLENEDSSSSTNDSDNETEKDVSPDVDPNEMIQAYGKEILKWQPWWTLKLDSLINELEDNIHIDLNQRMVDDSSSIDVSKANPLFYNEILQNTYLYIIITYVYQLSIDDLTELSKSKTSDVDIDLIDEICAAYIELDKIAGKRRTETDLTSKLDFTIACLLQENSYFLKSYVNKKFLTNLLDDLFRICKHPTAHRKVLSHLYTLFETNLVSTPNSKPKTCGNRETIEIIEKPLNVFHSSGKCRVMDEKKDQEKKSRVEILSKRVTPKSNERSEQKAVTVKNETSLRPRKTNKKESRLMMKKLEFQFKWLNVNMSLLQNKSAVDLVCGIISSLQESIQKDLKLFDAQNQLVNTNLDFIRRKVVSSNKKLIEEL